MIFMVEIQNHLGKINITKQFFAALIGGTVTNCFGVVDMNVGNTKQTIIESLPFIRKKTYIDKGVTVSYLHDKLIIDLHITVMYGVNVASVVKSIQHKVRYVIEDETDIPVEKVNVYIDAIKS